jgi:methylglutaconyl-CoA hydratase
LEKTEKELQNLLNLFRKAAPGAIKKSKRLILDLNESDQKEKLINKTSAIIAEARASEEGQEGLAAFFEKRKATWVNENI